MLPLAYMNLKHFIFFFYNIHGLVEMLHICQKNWSTVLQTRSDLSLKIAQFRYIKIQPNTIDLRTTLWGINLTNPVFIPRRIEF